MLKQLKYIKVAALIAALVSGGELVAVSGGTSTTGTTTSGTTTASIGGGTNAAAYAGSQNTPSETVVMPTLVALKTESILELVSSVATEAAAAMNDDGDRAAEATNVKTIASSTGSAHKASTWVKTSFTAIDSAVSSQQWSGQQYLVMGGADYRFNKIFCAGLGLGYTRLNARTQFNSGHMNINTFSVNPYLLINAHKNVNFEIVGGWDASKGNDDRTWFGTTSGTTGKSAKIKASPKSNTMFGGIFMNVQQKFAKGHVSGQVGYISAKTTMKKFTESSVDSTYAGLAKNLPENTYKVQTATSRFKAAYHLTETVSPFIMLHGSYDVKKADAVQYGNGQGFSENRSSYGGGFGMKAKHGEAFNTTLGFDYTQRGQVKFYNTSLNLHFGF